MKGRRHKVLLVVDGHPAHKANLVKEYIAELVLLCYVYIDFIVLRR
jgi:hypothetical protein